MAHSGSHVLEPLESRRLLTYTLTDLQYWVSGGVNFENGVGSSPDINNVGTALGYKSTGVASLAHAMLRVVRSGVVKFIDVGKFTNANSNPRGLNEKNQSVEESTDSKSVSHAYLSTLGKKDAVTLKKLGDVKGLTGTIPYAVNAGGVVVGIGAPGLNEQLALVWTPGANGTYTVAKLPRVAPPLVSGSPAVTTALDVSDAGVIVGYGQGPAVLPHAAIWKKTSKGYAATDLGALSGGLGNSNAYAINELSQAVGSSTGKDFKTHPVLFAPNSKGKYAVTDLGLPAGADEAVAIDINETGVIVGKVHFSSGEHAFLWAKNSKGKYVGTDLNAQLPKGSKWTLDEATSINDSNTIVGNGSFGAGARTWMLTFSGKGYAIKLAPVTASVQSLPSAPPTSALISKVFSTHHIAESILL